LPKSKGKKSIIRLAIIKELKRRHKTAYQVAEEHGGVHPVTVKKFLYCGKDAKVSTVEHIMEMLGLKIVPRRT
jgi:hypothetical protein